MVSKKIGVLDDGTDQDQTGCRHIRGGDGTDAPGLKRKKRCQESPQHSALSRFAVQQKAHQQNCDRSGEGKQRQSWDSRPGNGAEETGVEKCRGGSLSGTADDGHKNGLEKQKPQPRYEGGNSQAQLAKHGEGDEV